MFKLLCNFKKQLIILLIFTAPEASAQKLFISSLSLSSIDSAHSPKKAAIMSTLLPGLGQAYNKKYWKIPIIYAGFASLAYFVSYNNTKYKTYREAYIAETDADSATINSFPEYSSQNLLTLQDYYRRNRDLSYIIAGSVYILNIIDATVDAHLFNFDISDELSVKISSSHLSHKEICPIITFTIKL